jgi:hypothetical protein
MPNIVFSQAFIVTGLVLLGAVGSFAGLAIKDRRPRESFDPSLIPTIPLMLLAGLVAMVAFVILLNLPGV